MDPTILWCYLSLINNALFNLQSCNVKGVEAVVWQSSTFTTLALRIWTLSMIEGLDRLARFSMRNLGTKGQHLDVEVPQMDHGHNSQDKTG